MKAALRWEPGRSDDFLQFALPTMAGEIKRHFRDHSALVRPPRRIQEIKASLRRIDDEHAGLAGVVDDERAAAELSVRPSDIREARQASRLTHPASLDQPTDSGKLVGEFLGSEDERIEQLENRLTIASLLHELTDRERRVLALRFVDELSQAEIGECLGVSQMQISRILRSVLDRLRQQLSVAAAA